MTYHTPLPMDYILEHADEIYDRIDNRILYTNEQTECYLISLKWYRPKIKIDGTYFICARVLMALYTNVDPVNAYICHTCNEMRCINSNHLYIGNASTNSKDAYKANPNLRNISSKAHCIFSDADIVEIFRLYASGKYFQSKLAKKFNCSQSVIAVILRRVRYSDVNVPKELIQQTDIIRARNHCG